MSYLLLDELFDELLEAAIDEGLHDHMAVYAVMGDEGFTSAIATSEGFVPLGEVVRSIRRAFHMYVKECFENG